ncbi:diacylglycerol kinase [Kluyvera georgiana ATCC 51603]|uniref:Diacylglycerol kinase n=2 Tax=Enterobacteriaceae TaxID=543 RepID=A0A1B7JSS1_9ENTR|nr:diacylglycerol kinase [Kluyvera georgiana ATCC 51603]
MQMRGKNIRKSAEFLFYRFITRIVIDVITKKVLEMANNTTGLTRIIKAAGYSWKGFRAAWINEAAFRQEGVASVLAIIIACWLDVDAITRVLLIGSVLLVMIVEILNSALEAVVDRIGSEYHELSGRAKDMGSAAVLLAIFVALITWGTLLWAHFH